MRTTPFVSVALVLVLSSCVPSVHPLHTDDVVVFKPDLIGTWSGQGDDDTWTFTQDGEKAYKLVLVDEPDTKGEFEVHLVKLGDRLFLDLFPGEPEFEASDFYKLHLLPVHTFMQVRRITPELEMSMMDPEWLGKLLEKDPKALAHERTDDHLVLTAKPKELQVFLLKHAANEDAWGDYSKMTRKAR